MVVFTLEDIISLGLLAIVATIAIVCAVMGLLGKLCEKLGNKLFRHGRKENEDE